MQQLEQLVTLVVASVKTRQVSVGMLNAYLIRQGMEAEEITLLMEIVALEVRLDPPRVAAGLVEFAYKV